MSVKAKNGYLQADYPFAPPHLLTIGYAIEMATDQICQYCGRHPAREEVRDGWIWSCATGAFVRVRGDRNDALGAYSAAPEMKPEIPV